MGFQSDFSLLDLEELHAAPIQIISAVVGQRYCLQNASQYRLENELLSKAWTITDATGDVTFRVRGKKVNWLKSKRELVDVNGNVVLYMEEKVRRICFRNASTQLHFCQFLSECIAQHLLTAIDCLNIEMVIVIVLLRRIYLIWYFF